MRNRIFSKPATIVAIVIAAWASVMQGCRVVRPKNAHAREQILYTSNPGDPRNFNPILITDATSGGMIGNLFDGLVSTNVLTLLPDPRLAEKWEVSKDQKTITFHLRHGVKWSDGAPFTARDVLFTMKVIYDPNVPTSMRPILLVDGKPLAVEAPDDYTVVMKMPRVFAPLLYSIGFPIIPEHVLKAPYEAGKFNQTWGIDTPPGKLVGLGQYKMTRYSPSQIVQYRRNPEFWMKDQHGAQLPRLHGEDTTIVSDRNAEYLRFVAGQTDIYGPRPEEVPTLKDRTRELNITVQKIGIDTGTLFFSFNRNRRHFVKNGVTSPKLTWFTDPNFLQAMAHAIDKKSIVNLVFHGLGEPAVADISPANKIFHNPNLRDYDFDPKLSAQLLETGGYPLKDGIRYDSKGNRVEFDLNTNTNTPERMQICTIFKQDVESLGIKVNLRGLEFTTLVDKLDSSFDWDCILIGFTGTIEPNDGANFYRSSGNLHIWNPNQPKPATPWEAKIDKLLDEGTTMMDPPKRAPYYWRIQQILHDQLPILEVVRQQVFDARRNNLEDYQRTVWGMYKPEWIQFKAE